MKQKKPKIDCLECGGPLRLVRKKYQFTESGLDNVVLKNIAHHRPRTDHQAL